LNRILLLFVDYAASEDLANFEILSFFFMLGSLELGRAYNTKALSGQQQTLLSHLTNLGLIYMPSPTSTQFFPTRLATTLTSDASALRSISGGFDEVSSLRIHILAPSNSCPSPLYQTQYSLPQYGSWPYQPRIYPPRHFLWHHFRSSHIISHNTCPSTAAKRCTGESYARPSSHCSRSDSTMADREREDENNRWILVQRLRKSSRIREH